MSNKNSTVVGQLENSAENFFDEIWRTWCRLCCKADIQSINVISGQCGNSINETSYSCNIDAVQVIGEFFRVQIKEDDKLPQVICQECCGRVKNLIQFRDRVNKTQQMYEELQKCTDKENLDLNGLLSKYGVFKDESLITQYRSELPVEEIFISDLVSVTCNADAANIDVKTEKVSIENQPNTLRSSKKIESQDPIGDENVKLDDKSYTSSEDEDSSSSEFSFGGLDSVECSDTGSRRSSEKKSKKSTRTSEDISREIHHSCSICSQSFQRRSNYYTHMKKKHGVFICSQCPSSFKSEFDLHGHMKDHQKLYNCHYCDQKFERKGGMIKHIRNEHENNGKNVFSCLHCDRKFERKGAMSRHIKIEHKHESPYVCDACGEAVLSKKLLKQHMLTHTDFTPYVCKDCGKGFKEKYRLKRHLEIHGDKLICTECGKQLSCRATFNNHMLVHSDKMPHRCDYCGRTFKRAKTLKYHLIAHTGLRPYSCDFCGKTFSTGSSCRFHKRTMHPAELAELEASGAIPYTKNVPDLNTLKAVARKGENLMPLASKQKGYINLTNLISNEENYPATSTISKIIQHIKQD
ncbi:PREDICTED: zinc finger protein weckle-like [Rhagoletis zephyria]|uniref:zinc finger protein weckle-like n=1 Tax=Rhagoletis zephyria TaxID=28612 RepID=UPI00081188C3|nr:PREDICTED: zinc finger protein weckle-like [Rhagoletis zephyria]